MKTIFTALLLLPMLVNAQAPSWQWAKQSIGAGHDYGFNIDTDADGNSYVTGTFQPPFAVFGSDTLFATTTYNSGFFVAKYDRNGNEIWARTISGLASMNATGIRLNADEDELLVTGYFKSTGKITFGTDSIMSTTFFDVYLSKYDTSGNSIWTINAGESAWNGQFNFDVGLDGFGNSYVAGTFEDSVYLKKYDPSGNEVWRKKYIGGPSLTFIWNVAVNPVGDAVVTGYFANTSLQFDNILVPNNSNGYTILLLKTNAQGVVQWAFNDGQVASLYKPDVAIDALDNVYITGYFNGQTCAFGNTSFTNFGANDIFLVKYNSSGNFVWAQHAGGHHFDQGNSLVVDDNRNVYLTGMFRLTAAFGQHFVSNNGDPDIYIAKYDENGTCLWAKQAIGALVDVGYGIALDDSANCYIAGRFTSPQLEFDNIILNNSSPQFNPYEFVIARLGVDSLTSLQESENHHAFSIYPNPLVNESLLVIPGESNNNLLEIFDLRGSLLHEIQFNGNSVRIDRESLAAGTYLVRVITPEWSAASLLMIAD